MVGIQGQFWEPDGHRYHGDDNIAFFLGKVCFRFLDYNITKYLMSFPRYFLVLLFIFETSACHDFMRSSSSELTNISYLQTPEHTGSWFCDTVASSFSFKESSYAMRNVMKWMKVSAQEDRESTSDWGRFPQAEGSCTHHSVVCYGNESPGWVVRFRHAEHQRLHPKMTVNIPILFLWPTRVCSSVFQNVTLGRNGNCMEILKCILPTNCDACLCYCSVMITRQ